MTEIQKLCDQEWEATGEAYGPKNYAAWHDAFIRGFRLARKLAADLGRIEVTPGEFLETRTSDEIRRLGEKEPA